MGATGICIATRGIICTPNRSGIHTTTCDHPVLHPTVEVRPTLRSADSQDPAPGPAGEPVLVSAQDMRPVIREGGSDLPPGTATEPEVVSATDLRPVIRDAEEE